MTRRPRIWGLGANRVGGGVAISEPMKKRGKDAAGGAEATRMGQVGSGDSAVRRNHRILAVEALLWCLHSSVRMNRSGSAAQVEAHRCSLVQSPGFGAVHGLLVLAILLPLLKLLLEFDQDFLHGNYCFLLGVVN